MSTVPLPPVGGQGPVPPVGGGQPVTRPEGIPVPVGPGGHESADPARAGRVPGRLRGLEVVAGILSAGVLLLGVGLVVAQLLAPRLGGDGLEAATGPGWGRASAALVVGVVGEVLRALRRRWATSVRAVAAIVVIVAVVALLWFTWWR